jgi:hypothetical protein
VITSFEVGSIFKIIDQATPALKKILKGTTGLDAAVEATRKNLTGLARTRFVGISNQFKALTKDVVSFDRSIMGVAATMGRMSKASTVFAGLRLEIASTGVVVGALASEWRDLALYAGEANAAMRSAGRVKGSSVTALTAGTDAAIASAAILADTWRAISGEIGTSAASARLLARATFPGVGGVLPRGGGRHGPRQGLHVSGVRTPIPGGHAHFRGGGNATMAALGAVAYGVYQEAEVEDVAARALITGQIKVDSGMRSTDAFKRLRDVIVKTSTATGFSPKEVGEAILTTERQFGGLSFMKRMQVEETLLPYAAAEARLKETTLPEAFKSLVGLMHMTGTFDPAQLPKLAKQFGYASMITPVPLPQFERALSYSLPILHAGMGMDPGTSMFLTAMTETAGITSSKSGTWIREFFSRLMPDVSGSKHGIAHNAGLEKLGLLKDGKPTWMVKDASGATDWMSSVGNLSGMLSKSLAAIPDTERLGVLRQTFGAQGGGFGALMNLPQFVEQLPILAEKMKAFTGGEDVIGQLLEASPVQQSRNAFAEIQSVLMDIGTVALPPVTEALREFSKVLKAVHEAWPEQGHWGGAPEPGSIGESLGKGMGLGAIGGALVGGALGLLGGPLAPASVPAGMAWGALYGTGLVGALYGAGHIIGGGAPAASSTGGFAPMGGLEFMPMGPGGSPTAPAGTAPSWLQNMGAGDGGGMKRAAPGAPDKLTLNIAPPPPAQVQIEAVPVRLVMNDRTMGEALLQFIVKDGNGPTQGSPYPDTTRGGSSFDFALLT